MDNREAIEIFNKWMDCKDAYQADPSCDGNCLSCEYYTSAEGDKEAMLLAVSALEQQEAIKSCTPPTDDWEYYADRLHDIAYQSGYEEGKMDAGKWTPVSEGMPEEHKWIGTEHFGTTISDEVYVTIEVPSGERITKHMCFQNGSIPAHEQRSIDVFYKGGKAVAWCPLPEPYQEDKA